MVRRFQVEPPKYGREPKKHTGNEESLIVLVKKVLDIQWAQMIGYK